MRALSLRNLLPLCLILVLSLPVKAQHASRIYVEKTGYSIGLNFGLADMFGDVGTASWVEHYTNSKYFDKVTFMGGMFGRYTIHPSMSFKFGLNYGSIYATDEWNYDLAKKAKNQGADPYQRYARAQRAKANILEGSILFEVSPFRINPEKKLAERRGQPYFGIGVGYFRFGPSSTVALGTKFTKTFDLKIEGNGFNDTFPRSYSLWQPCIPTVIGYRWDIGEHFNIGVEYRYRITFCDYLDGVSGKFIDPREYAKHLSASEANTARLIADNSFYEREGIGKPLTQPMKPGDLRGNPENNDNYSSFSLVFYYKLFVKDKRWWREFADK